jgi:hypothetical protein
MAWFSTMGIEMCVPRMGMAATSNLTRLIWLLADASLQERLSGTCPYKGETNRPQPPNLVQFSHLLKVGRCTTSVGGTSSSGFPALRQAASPPTTTNALNPFWRKRCATLALVASFRHVQYK